MNTNIPKDTPEMKLLKEWGSRLSWWRSRVLKAEMGHGRDSKEAAKVRAVYDAAVKRLRKFDWEKAR